LLTTADISLAIEASSAADVLTTVVMAGLDPAIHVFASNSAQERGWSGHLREDALRAFARA
jgi:hypothetical protein